MTKLYQRLSFATTVATTASAQAMDAIAQMGVALPGSVVTVNPQDANTAVSKGNVIVEVQFDPDLGFNLPNVVIPVYGADYIRQPIQEGDLGVAIPCRLRIDGTTSMWRQKNDNVNPVGKLQSLIWLPVGNAQWDTVWIESNAEPAGPSGSSPSANDLNRINLHGPQGAVIFDWNNGTSNYYAELDSSGGVTISNQAKETVWNLKNDDVKLTVGSSVVIEATNSTITLEYGSGAIVTITNGQIELQVSSTNLIMTSSGISINGNVTVTGTIHSTGDMSAGSVTMQTHTHTYNPGPGSPTQTSVGSG